MSWTRRIFLLSALIAAGALAFMVARQRQLTPAEQLSEFEARVERREHHSEAVLLDGLESIARQAAARGEASVAARALTTRGRLLLELGAASRAREDFQRVLVEFLPGDLETRRLAAGALIAAGAHEAALRDLESLLADEPDYAPAWVQVGDLHREIAHEHLARSSELLTRVLTRDALEQAQTFLARLAAQDHSDPRRATTVLRLRELGSQREDEIFSRAMLLTDDASRELALARAAYARSLERAPDPDALAGLVRILVDAGELDLASDLGQVARRHLAGTGGLAISAPLLRAHVERGDMRSAAVAARDVISAPSVGTDLLLLASRAFYETRDFHRLAGAEGSLLRLRQTSDRHTPIAELYAGLLMAQGSDPSRAVLSLRHFAISPLEDPFPGARLRAWSEVARLARESGDSFVEREALHAAVQLAPEADANIWRRLYELQLEGGSPSAALPLASLTQALRLAPRQTEELLPIWRSLGRRSLDEEDIDLPSLFEGLRTSGQALPSRQPRPFLMFRLAELWHEAGDPSRVRHVARRLLDELPDFLPAVDLALEAALELRRWHEAAELLVRRIEMAGLTPASEELMARLPSERLSPDQVLRLMEAAPGRYGRLLLAQRQRADGHPELALATLAAGGVRSSPEAQVLAAEVLAEGGDYLGVLALELDTEETGPQAARARHTALLAALRTQDIERVQGLVAAALADPSPRRRDLLALADLLLHFRETELARRLLKALDEPGATRDEQLYSKLAVAALLDDELEPARMALARADFFAASSGPLLGLLLLRAQEGAWDAAAPLARELRSEERVAGVRDILLALIDDQAEEAAILAEHALAGRSTDAAAQLARGLARVAAGLEPDVPRYLAGADGAIRELAFGNEAAPRDPRQTAALLLALETPPYGPLARRELRSLMRANLARPWPAYLQARSDRVAGDPAAARRTLEGVVRSLPGFRPAWEELEHLQRERLAPAHPELLELEARRRAADRDQDEDDPRTHLARAEILLGQSRAEAALESAELALEKAPEWGAARAARASALTALGDAGSALEAWAQTCLAGTPGEAYRYAPAYIAALRQAQDHRPPALLPRQIELALERLRERLPSDPLVVLAQAEQDLGDDSAARTQSGVRRVRARLAAFRARHAGVGLESLRPGSAERWGELLLGFDPRAALDFVASELRLDPAHVGLRVLRARALRAEGRLRESLISLENLLRMASDPRIDLERVAGLVAAGTPPPEVERLTRSVQGLEMDRASVSRLQILRARSRLVAGAEARAQILEDLEREWRAGGASRTGPAHPGDSVENELAYLYALHLSLGDPRPDADPDATAGRIREVIEDLLPRTRDPYRAVCLQALAGLAREAGR